MIISHDGWIKIEAEDLISAGRKPTTREAIYNLLRDQGPMLAGEIAAELGMSMEAVRSAIRRDNEGVFTRDKDGFYDV
jgi:Mn-dependent DtxR family transcriptional regulator